jgi:hypothetical protein
MRWHLEARYAKRPRIRRGRLVGQILPAEVYVFCAILASIMAVAYGLPAWATIINYVRLLLGI